MKTNETISKDLKFKGNPRKISDKQRQLLKDHIEELGDLSGVVYCHNQNAFVGGNQRTDIFDGSAIEIVETYKKPNEVGTVAYGFINHNNERFAYREVNFTEEQFKKACIVANNDGGDNDWQILNSEEWDNDKLEEWGLEIQEFEEDITELEAEEDDFDVPEGGIETDIILGDLIEIGEHRLLCGDSTCSDTVAKLMNGEKADMVFTDPPYNIDFQGSMSNKMVNGKKAPADSANQRHDEIKNDAMSDKEFYNFISDVLKEIKINCSGAYYICFGSQTLNQLLQPLLDLGIEYKSIIVWMKNQAIFSGKDFKSRYEPIVYGRFNDFFNGARFNEEDIWEFARTQKNDLHPTMKPIPLIENALNYSSKEGMKILDLFLGSGSTMVASHQLKRKCYGMELDPKYCQVIVDRMIKLDENLEIKLNGKKYVPKIID